MGCMVVASLIVMLLSGCAQKAAAQTERGYLVVGVSLWLPPFGFPGPDGWSGLDVALAHALSQVVYGEPSHVQVVPLAPGDRRWSLEHGEVDVVAAAFAHPTPEVPGMVLVGPYYTAPMALLVRDADAQAPWGFLDGALVGYLQGGQAPTLLHAALPSGVGPVFLPFGSVAAAAAELATGHIAAVAAALPSCQALADRDGALAIRTLAGAPETERYWVLLRPDETDLAQDVAEAIALLPRGEALSRQVAVWNAQALRSAVLPPSEASSSAFDPALFGG